jgi:N utilization substance protein B
LDRQLQEGLVDEESSTLARELVGIVARHREELDDRIERLAPTYPVVQLARIDRSLLRSALGELLHSATTPAAVAISEWVELAREYSGESARRLLNGILGRVADEAKTERRSRTSGRGPTGGQ